MASTAAVVSLTFVLVVGFLSRRLKWAQLVESMRETAYQTAALFFIAVGAKIFVSFVSLTGITGALVEWVSVFGLENRTILFVVVLMYLVMGMFLDPLGTMLLTLPFVVVFPVFVESIFAASHLWLERETGAFCFKVNWRRCKSRVGRVSASSKGFTKITFNFAKQFNKYLNFGIIEPSE